MNTKERFLETVHFGNPDRVPNFEPIIRKATMDRWLKEGLPADVHLTTYFGLDRWQKGCPVNLMLVPPFDEVILEEDERYILWIDKCGAKRKDFKDPNYRGSGFVTRQWLDWPVKNREDWLRMKERWNPKSTLRYPEYWEDLKHWPWRKRDFPMMFSLYGPWAFVVNMMGLEGTCKCFYRDPDLIHEMMDYSVDFNMKVLDKPLKYVEIDFIWIHEDMAYKTGPMIGPRMFREFMLPGYKKLAGFLREHEIDTILVDTDGNPEPLIPFWLEAGVSGFGPCEIAASLNPVALRKKYPHLVLWGGIDKRELAKDKTAIKKEVMSKVPYLVKTGGYIPTIDHAIPADVPLKNYLYYLRLKRKILEGNY
jgi:hypothetical protein